LYPHRFTKQDQRSNTKKSPKESSEPKKSQRKGKPNKGACWAQLCKIVFSKSKPEPSGPGDIALKRQKKVSQEQKRKSATEKCNRGAISTVSIQTKPFHLFLLLSFFFFPF